MHELSLATAMVRQVQEILEREQAEKVISITVVIGDLSGVSREAFGFCFPAAAQGSALEGAVLHIQAAPIQLYCQECEKDSQPEEPYLLYCGKCQSGNVTLVAGRECIIQSLEVV